MHPVDEKRIMREFELWLATRGPDYSTHEREVSVRKAEIAKGVAATREAAARIRTLEFYHPSELGGRDGDWER